MIQGQGRGFDDPHPIWGCLVIFASHVLFDLLSFDSFLMVFVFIWNRLSFVSKQVHSTPKYIQLMS